MKKIEKKNNKDKKIVDMIAKDFSDYVYSLTAGLTASEVDKKYKEGGLTHFVFKIKNKKEYEKN